MTKPLLILPPAPARWPGVEKLLTQEKPAWLADLEARLAQGLPGARDACAIIPDGGNALSFAMARRRGDVAVLSHVFTHPDRRRQGYARALVRALVDWFDMTGGKWLYLSCEAPLRAFYESFGFRVLHEARSDAEDSILLRTATNVAPDPLAAHDGTPELRDVIWSDWPQLVALLQHRPGPDARAPLIDTAMAAAHVIFDLLAGQAKGSCKLIGEARGGQLMAFASIATDQVGTKTYALITPASAAQLREPALRAAQSIGYTTLEFPMDLLAAAAPMSE